MIKGDEKTYSWKEINRALYESGYSPKAILKISQKLNSTIRNEPTLQFIDEDTCFHCQNTIEHTDNGNGTVKSKCTGCGRWEEIDSY